jgi:diguanylate cyclase (GGDEF)-like protein
VLVFDVDHFKRFNDTYGHDAGDALLKRVGHALRTAFREADIVCRFGGEEFVAILPECDLANALARAERVGETIRGITVHHEGQVLGGVTASAGVSVYPLHGHDADGLFQAADRALYRSKSDGRDRVTAATTVTLAPAPPPADPRAVA